MIYMMWDITTINVLEMFSLIFSQRVPLNVALMIYEK